MHAFTPLEDLDLSDKRDARTYARSMFLNGSPVSSEANSLISSLVGEVIVPQRGTEGQVRPTMVQKYNETLGPFIADLLDAARADRWSKLATHTNALTRLPGGATAFRTMRQAMRTAGLLEELPGYKRTYIMFGYPQTRSSRTSFRPSAALLKMAEEHGVRLQDLRRHFTTSKASVPIALDAVEARAEKMAKKDRPKRLPVDLENPRAALIASRMEKLNSYLMAPGRVDGIAFAGLRRVFSNADRPDFDWQWHGRFYSMPGADAYENMEGRAAARGRVIRIDGSEVAEVDISAAHLTILHGLLGVPFDPSEDPYAIPGVERDKVKDWLLTAIGSADPDVGGNRFLKPRKAGLARYPFLGDLASLGITALDLQYHEAEIMRVAMETIMEDHGVGFLPVHDALIVAKGDEEIAAEALRGAFQRHFETLGLTPPAPRIH